MERWKMENWLARWVKASPTTNPPNLRVGLIFPHYTPKFNPTPPDSYRVGLNFPQYERRLMRRANL